MSLFGKTQKSELEALEMLAKGANPTNSKLEESRCAFRARIILASLGETKPIDVAKELGTSRQMVEKWVGRYQIRGIDGLRSRPIGRPKKVVPEE